jgi:DNA replication and repair protein RecF
MTPVDQLYIDGVRNLSAQTVALSPGLNFFFGRNGAGKTSVLEALHVLSRGRSFRGHAGRGLLQRGRSNAVVRVDSGAHSVGLDRQAGHWQARHNGCEVPSLATLARLLPVMVFHPESHGEFFAEADVRRRLLDWLVFHVKPAFAGQWAAYQRALKQRNSALAAGDARGALAFEPTLVHFGLALETARVAAFAQLKPLFEHEQSRLDGGERSVQIGLKRGWDVAVALADALAGARERDLSVGYSTVGPHRADIELRALELRASGTLSRGEGKLAVLALTLACVSLVASALSAPPVLLLDDLAAELDQERWARLLGTLGQQRWQILATGVSAPKLDAWPGASRVFHVEHGHIQTAAASP